MFRAVLAAVLIATGTCQVPAQGPVFYGPPIVEKAPLLLSSFLPASMQIIAHLTELMKYDIRPTTGGTSTTIRPTPAHKPGVYSPKNPLGPAAYFARGTSYQEYIERLKSPQGFGYFDRYMYPLEHGEQEYLSGREQKSLAPRANSFQPPSFVDLADNDLELLGLGLSDLLKQVNKIDDYDFVDDDDAKVQKFSENYDDSSSRNYVIGNKKIPPTRAYVTLLSLYDLLNKESKKLQLNKYGGYATDVLQVLTVTATGTSADQLHTVLGKAVERRDVKEQQIVNKIKTLLTDLEQSGSYINDALRYIPPLQFTQ